jgi:hypothetical protein
MESNIEGEIEAKAREKAFKLEPNSNVITFIDKALNMKCQIDSNNEGKQRTKYELAILYKRFIVSSKESIIPFSLSRCSDNVQKKVDFLNKQVADAEKSYSELLKGLKSYGPTGMPNNITGN